MTFLFLSLLLALTSAPAQDLRVDGLRDGERAWRLAPASGSLHPASDELARGRVLDASTGFPVAGATIETWTEEIDALAPGFRRIGAATSGRDGGFLVRVREGVLRAEKVRATAPGYLAAPGVVGDLRRLLLFPRPDHAPVLRVVDLEGRGLPDALVTTTYSCAHDVPAFVERTDPLGFARLDAWGLQDATPELRVRAGGYGAWKYLDLEDVLEARLEWRFGVPRDVPIECSELRLARRAPFGARLVDEAGRPVSGASLHVVDGDGFHVVRTGEDGRFRVDAPYGDGAVTIYELGLGRERHVFSGRLPRGREVELSTTGNELPEAAPRSRLVLELPPLAGDERRPALHVFHASGWNDFPRRRDDGRRGLELPSGTSVLAVGGAFSGWEEELIELSLAPGEERALRLEPRREPRLTILSPTDDGARLVVQVGDDSTEVEDRGEGRVELPVPRGGPLVLLREGADVRRLKVPAIEDDLRLDLRGPGLVLAASRQPGERVRVDLAAFDIASEALGGSLEVFGPHRPQVAADGPGRYVLDARVGSSVGLLLRAPGHAADWRLVYVTPSNFPLELRPTPLASLAIESALELEVEGPEAEHLDALHPGPLELVLRAPDGRRVGVSLELQPDEHRRLKVE